MSDIKQAIDETQKLLIAIKQAQQANQTGNINALDQVQVSPDDLLAMERTKLAQERTKLANQRTLLSYIRTSLGFFAGAATLVQFFENKKFVMAGYLFIPLGLLSLFTGFYSYYKSNRAIKNMELIRS